MNGCKNSEKISWMKEFLNTETHAPVLLMIYHQSPRQREVWIWVNTVFILTSLKTEIARSSRGPKSQGPRAEDAIAEPYLVQKILVTWQRRITKFSVKIVNLETIIDMESWCRTWPPNGSSRIRAKQNSQETQRSLQKFLEPNRKPKVIYTDNSTPHRSETDGISVKEGTSAVLLQSGLNESWWADFMECYTYLRNVTDLWSDGKTSQWKTFWAPM